MRAVLARSPAYRRLNRAVYEAKQWRERLARGQPRRESAKVAFMVRAAARGAPTRPEAAAHVGEAQITTATREKLAALGYSAQQVKDMRPDEALAAAERDTAPAAFQGMVQSLREEAAAASASPPAPVSEASASQYTAVAVPGGDDVAAPAPMQGAEREESPAPTPSAPAPALRPQPEAEECH